MQLPARMSLFIITLKSCTICRCILGAKEKYAAGGEFK
jgi:hypothetical protein